MRGCGAPHVVRKASPPLEHTAARTWAHRVVYLPQSGRDHAHMTGLCKLESTFQMYKTSAWDSAVGLFKPWSTGSCVNALKRGFASLKSHWGGGTTLATAVCKTRDPYFCLDPFCISKEIRKLDRDLGWAIPGINSHNTRELGAQSVGSEEGDREASGCGKSSRAAFRKNHIISFYRCTS